MRVRISIAAAVCVAAGVVAFVLLHTGGPGDATCLRSRFVNANGFSSWPPGVRCTYGEPARTDVLVNGWFAGVVVLLGVAFAVARALLRDWSSGPGMMRM